ncbi:MAG: 6-bladed beta-propeller, partial [Phycisphaerae bacterium]|nr:6-bladed beta-propeller [Phycisphaerae bacterium]
NRTGYIVVGPDGSIYVTTNYEREMQKFSPDGVFLKKWGGYCKTDTNYDNIPDQPCEGKFYGLSGLAVDADGNLYTAEKYNDRIQKFDADGNFIKQWGHRGSTAGLFKYVQGLSVTSDGYLYAADTYNQRVQKFDTDGNFITAWGTQGSDAGEFMWPDDVAVSEDGTVYVTDRRNHRLQLFDKDGNFLEIWD